MGQQLNFYLTDKDTEMVEGTIRAIEPVTILHRRSPSPQPRILDALCCREDGAHWPFFDLLRPEDLASLSLRHVAGPDYWTTDVRRDPVLEFNRSSCDGKVIRRGRIYFVAAYFDGDGVWTHKDEDFVKWGQKVIRRVRGALFRHEGFYIGPDAKELLERSQVSLGP